MQIVKKAVILAGGLGTRFLPASKAIPKEMFPVLDKPILQYLVEELVDAGINEIIIVLGRHKEIVLKHFNKCSFLEKRLKQTNKPDLLKKLTKINELPRIRFVKNVLPKGAGYALLKAKKHLKNEPFILLVGDEIGLYKSKNSIQQILHSYYKYNKNIIGVSKEPAEKMVNYGMIVGKKVNPHNYEILNLIEKPKLNEVTSNLAASGKYIFKPSIFEKMKETKIEKNKEIQYNNAIMLMIKENDVNALLLDYKRYDTGSKLGYVLANLDLGLLDEDIKKELFEELKKRVEEKSE